MSNPAPEAVYQTARAGNFTYAFTNLPTGFAYQVRLHFAELDWSAAGQRAFNVFLNGAQVLTNFDVFAAAGAQNKAVVRQFTVSPNPAGELVAQFASMADSAEVNGIEVQQLIALPAPSGLSATAGLGQVLLSWNAAAGATGYNVKRANTSGGPYTILVMGVAGTAWADIGVTNGTAYYYVVSALNGGSERANSGEARATALAAIAINSGGGRWPAVLPRTLIIRAARRTRTARRSARAG